MTTSWTATVRPDDGRPAPIEAVRDLLTFYRQDHTRAALCLWYGLYYMYGRAEARLLLQAVCKLDAEDASSGWNTVSDVQDFLWTYAPETIDNPHLQEV